MTTEASNYTMSSHVNLVVAAVVVLTACDVWGTGLRPFPRNAAHQSDSADINRDRRYPNSYRQPSVNLAAAVNGECRHTTNGTDYRGRRATTLSGRTCQRWDSQHPHQHTRYNVTAYPQAAYNRDNYCRNPDGETGSGPWCYSMDPDVRWETCAIPMCPDCRMTSLGIDYRGTRALTMSGNTCQRWDSQYPHQHSRNDVAEFPDAIHNQDNYCRNPDNDEGGPWCYTTDLGVRWETCAILFCDECRESDLGSDYRGPRNVTISGRTCQRWDSQYPHRHLRNDVSQFPDARYNTVNHCRNPDHEDGVGPWCYTTDPGLRWETCGLPLCPGSPA